VGRRFRIVICRGPECGDRRGSATLYDAFRQALDRAGATNAELAWQSCFGRCTQGPNVLVRELLTEATPSTPAIGTGFATMPSPRGTTALYNRVDSARIERIVRDHVTNGEIVRDYIERPGIHPAQPLGSDRKDS
jgi:(2Fe-2S) ferredoxin